MLFGQVEQRFSVSILDRLTWRRIIQRCQDFNRNGGGGVGLKCPNLVNNPANHRCVNIIRRPRWRCTRRPFVDAEPRLGDDRRLVERLAEYGFGAKSSMVRGSPLSPKVADVAIGDATQRPPPVFLGQALVGGVPVAFSVNPRRRNSIDTSVPWAPS